MYTVNIGHVYPASFHFCLHLFLVPCPFLYNFYSTLGLLSFFFIHFWLVSTHERQHAALLFLWLILHSMIPPVLFVLQKMAGFYSYHWLNNILLYLYVMYVYIYIYVYIFIYIYSSVYISLDERQVWFHILALVNSAPGKIVLCMPTSALLHVCSFRILTLRTHKHLLHWFGT